jgi:glycosyltransferase involved in cell wall biosynthesis
VIVLDKLLSRFVEIAPRHEYHVLANGSLPRALDSHPQVRYHCFNWIGASYAGTALWHAAVLSRWCVREHVDVLFSQVCYLPPFGPRHTVLLLQDARFFYHSEALRQCLGLSERLTLWMKKRWCYQSVAGASRVLVQSDAMARSVAEKVPSARSRISVVPPRSGVLGQAAETYIQSGCRCQPRYCVCGASRRFAPGPDSRPRPIDRHYQKYKNFEVLLRALRVLQGERVPVLLHLTLDLVEEPGGRMVMSYARKLGVEHLIINHGELEPERVAQVYQSAHVFVFPSVCESFGFPQVEAMAFGLPILAADTAVNREMCRHAAIYFAPEDDRALAAQLKRLYQNPAELAVLSKRCARRGHDFDWTNAAAQTLEHLTNAVE